MSSVLHACAMDDVSWGGDFVAHSLTPLLVWCVTAGYEVRAPFKFSSKSIGFPRAKHHIGFIFSCENLTDIGQISLCWKCYKPQDILNQKWEHICDVCGKNNAAETCCNKMFYLTSSLVFESPRRSNHMLNQWRQYYHCRWNCYCCFIK